MFTQKYKIGEPVFVLTLKKTGTYPNIVTFCTITKSVVIDIHYVTKYHNANFDPKKPYLCSGCGIIAYQDQRPADIVIDSVAVKYKVAHRVETIPEDMVFPALDDAEHHIENNVLHAFYKDALRYKNTNVDQVFMEVRGSGYKGVIIYNQANI